MHSLGLDEVMTMVYKYFIQVLDGISRSNGMTQTEALGPDIKENIRQCKKTVIESFHMVKSTTVSVHSVEKNSWAAFEKQPSECLHSVSLLFKWLF